MFFNFFLYKKNIFKLFVSSNTWWDHYFHFPFSNFLGVWRSTGMLYSTIYCFFKWYFLYTLSSLFVVVVYVLFLIHEITYCRTQGDPGPPGPPGEKVCNMYWHIDSLSVLIYTPGWKEVLWEEPGPHYPHFSALHPSGSESVFARRHFIIHWIRPE